MTQGFLTKEKAIYELLSQKPNTLKIRLLMSSSNPATLQKIENIYT